LRTGGATARRRDARRGRGVHWLGFIAIVAGVIIVLNVFLLLQTAGLV